MFKFFEDSNKGMFGDISENDPDERKKRELIDEIVDRIVDEGRDIICALQERMQEDGVSKKEIIAAAVSNFKLAVYKEFEKKFEADKNCEFLIGESIARRVEDYFK